MEPTAIQPLQRAEVPDLEEVPPLSERDFDCIREVRDVLAKHGALERFGLSLLHQHFDLAPDECLVEFVDYDTRTLITRPVKSSSLEAQRSIETQWRLSDGSAVTTCNGRCFPG